MRVRFTNLVALLALPAVGPALAPFCAEWHWSLDLLACLPVQAMLCLGLAGAILLAARRWWFAGIYLGLALLAGASVLPAWLADHRAPATSGAAAQADGPALRVLSLNLLRGNEAQAAAALAVVADAAPDLLFCSEVTPAWLASLEAGLQAFPHRYLHADEGFFGVALFSRLPLREAKAVPLGFSWAPAVRAIVDTAAGPVGVLGVHTPRPGGALRNAERDQALAAIAPTIASLPARRLVLGDCNATPWNPSYQAMLAASALTAASDRSFRPTWPAQLPWPLRIPIDHVLVSVGIAVTEVAVGASFGSDHLPLLAGLRLGPP